MGIYIMNVYEIVTNRIIEELKNGVIPWQKPWVGKESICINYVSRKKYSLLNQILLGKPGEWLTFKQIQDRKGYLKKGAKGRMVVYFSLIETSEKDKDGNFKKIPILKYYKVFHLDDVQGIQSKITIEETEHNPIEEAEAVISNYLERENLKFSNHGSKAYYSPTTDEVKVPAKSQFSEISEYYSTVFHELTHSTLHENRCNRREETKGSFFGNTPYSREELVAELGAAMLCNITHIDCQKAFKNSVAYIQSWLEVLENDVKMIVWASSRAEKATKYIIGEPDEAEQYDITE